MILCGLVELRTMPPNSRTNGNRITWITDAVFGKLAKEAKYSTPGGTLMWDQCAWNDMGGQTIYGSNWTWAI
jgi:hypothetical protein